jgi:hypothetical protein
MAGGMLTKQADFLTGSTNKLNTVNDAASGGVVVSVPAGAPSPYVSQTIPGDRIVLDDATALALSNTATGTLYGGVYMYVGTVATSTAAPARGTLAFWLAANLPNGATPAYTVTADAQPAAATPTYIAGVFINAITKGNFGWIQVAGTSSNFFDSSLTATNAGLWVSAKVSPGVASTSDVGAAVGTTTLSALLGTAIGSPTASQISAVLLWRGFDCGRI